MKKAPEIHIIEDVKFNEIRHLVKSTEKNAFTCLHKDWTYVILRESFVRKISEDEFNVVVNHELAHVNGIMNEEEADIWAMERLTVNQQKILIDMWQERHGYEYS